MSANLTLSQRRALEILREHPDLLAKEFARLMWPDSDCWRHPTKCGYGVHRGGGMYLAAGGFLGKLYHKGLVQRGRQPYTHAISRTGIAALAARPLATEGRAA